MPLDAAHPSVSQHSNGSALHHGFPWLQPGHAKIEWFRVLSVRLTQNYQAVSGTAPSPTGSSHTRWRRPSGRSAVLHTYAFAEVTLLSLASPDRQNRRQMFQDLSEEADRPASGPGSLPCPSEGVYSFAPSILSHTGFTLFSPRLRTTLQLSLTLLVRYRTTRVFRVGSIALPYSQISSETCYSLSLRRTTAFTPTGLSPSAANPSRMSGLGRLALGDTTSPRPFRGGIQFALCPFRSPLRQGIAVAFFSSGYGNALAHLVTDRPESDVHGF